MTPLTCSNTAWIPQKQPPASTAVCWPLVVAKGSSTTGLGMTVALAELHATSAARARKPESPAKLRRSEEHTSELQSPCNLVCRLLLEKKKNTECDCMNWRQRGATPLKCANSVRGT